MGRQMIWFGVTLFLGGLILFLDGKTLEVIAPFIYLACILLLLFVLFFGKEVAGSRSWIRIGSFGMQPAEFAKIGTALFLAQLMSQRKFSFNSPQSTLLVFGVVLLPIALIILQGDTGSALVFTSFALMFYRGGFSAVLLALVLLLIALSILVLKFNYFWPMGLIGLAAILFYSGRRRREQMGFGLLIGAIAFCFCMPLLLSGLSITFALGFLVMVGGASFLYYRTDYLALTTLVLVLGFQMQVVDFGYKEILRPHQQTRIDVLLGKNLDVKGVGYNINQSKIAIGSGGLLGKGHLKGTQTKGNFVPAQKTDFIFCTIAEEWGFLGSLLLIGLFIGLLMRLVVLAERQRRDFSLLFIYGVIGIILFHFTINIGMTIGLAPIIGIPLPFISYGGSSLLAFSVLIFLVLRLDTDRMLVR